MFRYICISVLPVPLSADPKRCCLKTTLAIILMTPVHLLETSGLHCSKEVGLLYTRMPRCGLHDSVKLRHMEKAGNGNWKWKLEMEIGNGNWKWKLETEMRAKNAPCFLHSVLSHYSCIVLSNGYATGFTSHVLLYCSTLFSVID